MIFKCPNEVTGQLGIFFRSTTFYILEREQTPIFTFSKKSNLQNNLNIPLHQKVAHRNFIINGFSFAEFCVTRAKLHFGEFSNLTFQAVSWLLLFSLGCLQARNSFIFPRNTTRTLLFALRQDYIFPLRRDYISLRRDYIFPIRRDYIFPLRAGKA